MADLSRRIFLQSVMQSVTKKVAKFCLLFKKVSVSRLGEKQAKHLLQWRFFKEKCYYNTPNCIIHIVGLFVMDRDNISLTWRPPQADFPLFTTKYPCVFSVFFLFLPPSLVPFGKVLDSNHTIHFEWPYTWVQIPYRCIMWGTLRPLPVGMQQYYCDNPPIHTIA